MVSLKNFSNNLKKLTHIIQKLFQKTEKEETFARSFFESGTILKPKTP